jgi:hypothetical protein
MEDLSCNLKGAQPSPILYAKLVYIVLLDWIQQQTVN